MSGMVMNVVVFACTSIITVLGVGYFCVDLYRNRNRHLSRFEPIADITGLDHCPQGLPAEHEIAHNAAHGVAEGSHSVETVLGKCVEAIAHTLPHH